MALRGCRVAGSPCEQLFTLTGSSMKSAKSYPSHVCYCREHRNRDAPQLEATWLFHASQLPSMESRTSGRQSQPDSKTTSSSRLSGLIGSTRMESSLDLLAFKLARYQVHHLHTKCPFNLGEWQRPPLLPASAVQWVPLQLQDRPQVTRSCRMAQVATRACHRMLCPMHHLRLDWLLLQILCRISIINNRPADPLLVETLDYHQLVRDWTPRTSEGTRHPCSFPLSLASSSNSKLSLEDLLPLALACESKAPAVIFRVSLHQALPARRFQSHK